MPDPLRYTTIINDRLKELDARAQEIEHELDQPKPADLNDQAIDIEDDEVLEGLGQAANLEIMLLKKALQRIQDGTFGICLRCEEPISEARLDAVPHAPLCKNCARGD